MEIAEFGTSHAEVGAYLLAIWGLPDPIVEAVAFHHAPSSSPCQSFSPLAAVHAADYLVNVAAHGNENMAGVSLDLDFLARIGLQDKLESWRATLSSANI